MQTITTGAVVVVTGFVLTAALVVIVLVYMSSRFERAIKVSLDARRLRLKISITSQPDTGAGSGSSTQNHDRHL